MGVREIDRSLEQWEMGVKDMPRRVILAPTPRERERWYAILLLAQGWTAAATAEMLERDPHTIGRWASAFGEGGPRALIFEQTGGSPPDRGMYLVFPLRYDRFLRIRRRAGMWFRKQQNHCQPVCLAPKRCRKAISLPSPQYLYIPLSGWDRGMPRIKPVPGNAPRSRVRPPPSAGLSGNPE